MLRIGRGPYGLPACCWQPCAVKFVMPIAPCFQQLAACACHSELNPVLTQPFTAEHRLQCHCCVLRRLAKQVPHAWLVCAGRYDRQAAQPRPLQASWRTWSRQARACTPHWGQHTMQSHVHHLVQEKLMCQNPSKRGRMQASSSCHVQRVLRWCAQPADIQAACLIIAACLSTVLLAPCATPLHKGCARIESALRETVAFQCASSSPTYWHTMDWSYPALQLVMCKVRNGLMVWTAEYLHGEP